jgi:hypothetical protein
MSRFCRYETPLKPIRGSRRAIKAGRYLTIVKPVADVDNRQEYTFPSNWSRISAF